MTMYLRITDGGAVDVYIPPLSRSRHCVGSPIVLPFPEPNNTVVFLRGCRLVKAHSSISEFELRSCQYSLSKTGH